MNDIPTLEEVVEAIKKDRDYGPYVERLNRLTHNEDGSPNFDFDPLKEAEDFVGLMGDTKQNLLPLLEALEDNNAPMNCELCGKGLYKCLPDEHGDSIFCFHCINYFCLECFNKHNWKLEEGACITNTNGGRRR